jgi:hypothetical protein
LTRDVKGIYKNAGYSSETSEFHKTTHEVAEALNSYQATEQTDCRFRVGDVSLLGNRDENLPEEEENVGYP